MPDYLSILNSALMAKDQKGIVEEAHKIKSAAGAVGLKRIYQIAQQAQSPELPAWQENIHDWIESISAEYQGDIAQLRQCRITSYNVCYTKLLRLSGRLFLLLSLG